MSSVRAASYITARGHVLGLPAPAVVAPHLPPAQVEAAVVGAGARPSLRQAPFVLPTKKPPNDRGFWLPGLPLKP